MMDDPVNDSRGGGGIVKDTSPLTKGQIGCHNYRPAFVAGGNQLEEQIGSRSVKGDVSQLIADHQVDS